MKNKCAVKTFEKVLKNKKKEKFRNFKIKQYTSVTNRLIEPVLTM